VKKRSRFIAVVALAAFALGAGAVGCGKTYSFEPVEVGDDGTDRAPIEKSNGQFVRAVYADLLGRAPESVTVKVDYGGAAPNASFAVDEQSTLLDALDSVGDPLPLRDALVAGVLDAPEVKLPAKDDVKDPAAFVTDQFETLLGRDPTTWELGAFTEAWRTDAAVGPKTVVRAILTSREYQSL